MKKSRCRVLYLFFVSAILISVFTLRVLAAQNGGDTVEYPDYLIKTVKNYPETKPLLSYYEQMRKDPLYFTREIDISSDLATDGVPLFLQWDKRWAFLRYGRETVMASSGCGPACLSMIMCYYTKNCGSNPYEMAKFAKRNGFYIENEGTSGTLFTSGARMLGMSGASVSPDPETVREFLDRDIMVVALMGPGAFTGFGHYIVIRGYGADGDFYVNDPNSLINTKKTWKQSVIFQQIRQAWAIRPPRGE